MLKWSLHIAENVNKLSPKDFLEFLVQLGKKLLHEMWTKYTYYGLIQSGLGLPTISKEIILITNLVWEH